MSDSVRTSEQTASGNAEPFVLEGGVEYLCGVGLEGGSAVCVNSAGIAGG